MKKSRKKKQTNKQIDQEFAERYRTVAATIARWRREKAPLGDEAAMLSWLSSRKNLPPGTKRLLTETRNAERAAIAAEDQKPVAPTELGPGAALRRLALSEQAHWKALERALKSGDPFHTKNAREGWLKVVETLRKCDLALEESRRGAGELVERKLVERILQMTGLSVRIALKGTLQEISPKLIGLSDARQIWSILEGCLGSAVDGVANFTIGSASEAPAWARESLSSGYDFLGKAWPPERLAAVGRICEFFSALSGASPCDLNERLRSILSALISQPSESSKQ